MLTLVIFVTLFLGLSFTREIDPGYPIEVSCPNSTFSIYTIKNAIAVHFYDVVRYYDFAYREIVYSCVKGGLMLLFNGTQYDNYVNGKDYICLNYSTCNVESCDVTRYYRGSSKDITDFYFVVESPGTVTQVDWDLEPN